MGNGAAAAVNVGEAFPSLPKPIESNVRESIVSLLSNKTYTQRGIAAEVGVKPHVVYTIARELRERDVTHSDIEKPLHRWLRGILASANPKVDSATETKNKAQAFGVLFDKERLLSDKSTSNVSHRSLSALVSRKPPSKPQALKEPVASQALQVPKDAEVLEQPAGVEDVEELLI